MNLIQSIDALLPQTQCGKCGHPGCMPYAQGIARGEAINKCPPGGEETIAGLALLLNLPVVRPDPERGLAPAQVAFIREAECIGCTKCIQACPVDAIVGAAKFMHTVIVDECTGCDLCVAPCPVDCIDLIPISADQATPAVPPAANVIALTGGLAQTPEERQIRNRKRDHARMRFEARNARLRHADERRQTERLARAQKPPATPAQPQSRLEATDDTAVKKARIAVAMSRAQLNKSLKAFGHPPIAEQAARLVELQNEYETAEQILAGLLATKPTEVRVQVAQVDTGNIKRAKIQLAMARAALKKAQTTETGLKEIEELNSQMQRAEQVLEAAEKGTSGSAQSGTTQSREILGS
ncbi:RnfABCDGE type electron transport complex subunit B [Pseudomonas caspiana]